MIKEIERLANGINMPNSLNNKLLLMAEKILNN